ncbi:MAG TPA: glycosyltransferase [Dehalococcoidia bacterium]|nr:glycosyltransferase [Dehalococcoidia bacterium]
MPVSVVVPVYNMARYLPACLDSLLAQQGVDLEVVVVDDGSSDDVEAAVAPYLGRVRFVRQPHCGLPAAINAGVAASGGELVAMMDADDLLLPGSLAVRARLLQEMPSVGLVFGAALVIDPQGRAVGWRRARLRDGLLPSAHALRWLLRGCRVPTSTVMVPRRVLDEMGPFRDEAYPGEDWHMWLLIASRYDLYYLDRPLACYRRHGGSVTAGYLLEEVERSHRFTLADLFARLRPEQRGLEPLARACLERTLASLAARLGRRRRFLGHLARAVTRRPSLLLDAETWGCLALGARSLLPAPALAAARRLKASVGWRRPRGMVAPSW